MTARRSAAVPAEGAERSGGGVPSARLLVGLDENGMGPRLGPLLCTAVATRASRRYRASRAIAIARELGIDDSKATSAHGRMGRAEGIALAAVETTTGSRPPDADALLAAIELDGPLSLRARCPRSTLAQCWSAAVPLPRFATDEDLARGRAAVRALRGVGLELVGIRCQYHCAAVINEAKQAGVHKLFLDLRAFERLAEDAWARHGRDPNALYVCGMVGGLRRYAPHLRLGERFPLVGRQERKGLSAYTLEGLGELRFEVGADAAHVPVALASMIGKLVRELAVERQNAFYARHVDGLAAASGYHDPVTARFVDATVEVRRELRIAESCFER